MYKKIIITITIVLLLLVIVGGLAFFIHSKIKKFQTSQPEDKPSIATLATLPPQDEELQAEEEISENESAGDADAKNDEESSQETQEEETLPVSDAKKTANVVVLNGGAAVGSAGKIEKLLKNDGYQNTAAANALNSNHVGQMIYYKPDAKADAESVQKLLKETYPEIEIKEGTTAEQTQGDIVVMLGK